ncbi:hypothetical protein BV22DRAFT_144413 [Leucogyrophana mollusca]|uniref:Uncharacterized protein n=1 Tax=Leucogyrophana mollusca TaxID=85980 RepID=A0ACB8BT39_9AGAM|nr:hypothetical protein BV22DRAFT_144413 [Leucogyrophana mollusca]
MLGCDKGVRCIASAFGDNEARIWDPGHGNSSNQSTAGGILNCVFARWLLCSLRRVSLSQYLPVGHKPRLSPTRRPTLSSPPTPNKWKSLPGAALVRRRHHSSTYRSSRCVLSPQKLCCESRLTSTRVQSPDKGQSDADRLRHSALALNADTIQKRPLGWL